MNTFSLFFAQADAPGGAGGAAMSQLLFIILIFAAMYFLLIAPQRKKQKQHDAMTKALQKGDKVITSGGIFGEITNVKEDRVSIQVSDSTKIDVLKSFVQSKVDQ